MKYIHIWQMLQKGNKTMKKLLFVWVSLILSLGIAAQPKFGDKKMSREEFHQFRYNYLTKKAGFTEEESTKFFPLYTNFSLQKFKLDNECRKIVDRCEKQLEEDVDAAMNKILSNHQAVVELEKNLYEEAKQVVSSEKYVRFHKAEMMFSFEMLRDFRRSDGRHRNPKQNSPERKVKTEPHE